MFIKQVKYIGSVGRFRTCAAEGDVTFKKFTLLFGENGRGKTTLCSILRSLETNNPDIVIGRRTLGHGKEPNVVLKLADGTALFDNGKWNGAASKLRIFDAQYVADNIYFGDAIGTEQRRNLCNLILGKDGVALANEYNELDGAINEKNTEIRQARRVLVSHVNQNEIEAFIALERQLIGQWRIALRSTVLELAMLHQWSWRRQRSTLTKGETSMTTHDTTYAATEPGYRRWWCGARPRVITQPQAKCGDGDPASPC
jgi:wobble nucleotide-excising tRNase